MAEETGQEGRKSGQLPRVRRISEQFPVVLTPSAEVSEQVLMFGPLP
jgi:hypothetical protein